MGELKNLRMTHELCLQYIHTADLALETEQRPTISNCSAFGTIDERSNNLQIFFSRGILHTRKRKLKIHLSTLQTLKKTTNECPITEAAGFTRGPCAQQAPPKSLYIPRQ